MKKVLITGANSYVGTNVEKWLIKDPNNYHVETLDMQNLSWVNFDFSKFDVVFHVAGIAHVSKKKSLDELYYKVNRDLAIETARKAKESGVRQFIFMSSMIIYGEDNAISDKRHIEIDKYNPLNAYGNSKLEADLAIQKLQDEEFLVSIVRTPVIYGQGCKGNFPRLQKIARKLFIVPKISNQRSMIFIDNFSEFIRQLINKELNGVFYPQNSKYVSTSMIIIYTRESIGKKTYSLALLNPFVRILTFYFRVFRKILGNKTYDIEISNLIGCDYRVVNVEDSIRKSISFD